MCFQVDRNMSKRKAKDARDKSLSEFEAQLAQEASLGGRSQGEESGSLLATQRRDADGVLYEFDSVKQAWFPKVSVLVVFDYAPWWIWKGEDWLLFLIIGYLIALGCKTKENKKFSYSFPI